MKRLAYIVRHDWARGMSGVALFVKLVAEDWKAEFDCNLIEYPAPLPECEKGTAANRGIDQPVSVCCSGWKLALGYTRDLFRSVGFFCSIRSWTKGRVLVTNQFGCELESIALRIVNPGARIIAIVHTHPGQNNAAMHPVRRFIEKLCLASVSGMVCNSNSVKKEWEKKLNRDLRKAAVIHYGISEPDLTLPDDYPTRGDGVVDFVCVSRFAGWKGHAKLLSSWKEASLVTRRTGQVAGEKMRLVLVGDGETFEECKVLAKDLDIADTVFFLGAKENGARYFNGADVAVQLSTEPEAFGLVLLEAMSRGVPVVASDMGGMSEVVEDGASGILVNPDNLEQVSDAITSLAADKERRRALGAKGIERWKRGFRVERMADDYREYFKEGSL